MDEERKLDKHGLYLLVPFFVIIGAMLTWLEPSEVKVKEVVVERETVSQVLNIKSVETVCHAGAKHFAVTYEQEGGSSWFIAARPTGSNGHGHVFADACDGTEEPHPGEKK